MFLTIIGTILSKSLLNWEHITFIVSFQEQRRMFYQIFLISKQLFNKIFVELKVDKALFCYNTITDSLNICIQLSITVFWWQNLYL